MAKQLITFSLLLMLVACHRQDRKITEPVVRDFHLPRVIQDSIKGTIKYFQEDSMNGVSYTVVGKYKFTDTIIHIKDAVCPLVEEDLLLIKNKDTLSSDGLQIIPDYNTTIYYYNKPYLPIYVVNETSKTKVLWCENGEVYGLQEIAKMNDFARYWYPIERYTPLYNCTIFYNGIMIKSQEFAVLIIPKYKGEEKGLMRVRLKIGEAVYLSEFFEGIYSDKQLNLSTRRQRFDRSLKEHVAISKTFYGATPKELETEQ